MYENKWIKTKELSIAQYLLKDVQRLFRISFVTKNTVYACGNDKAINCIQ